jgi:hypothetical protein
MITGEQKMRQAAKGMRSKSLHSLIAKDETIQIRVSSADKVAMKALAKELDVTLTEYLCCCHRIVSERLEARE